MPSTTNPPFRSLGLFLFLLFGLVIGSSLFFDWANKSPHVYHDIPQELLAYRETHVLSYLVPTGQATCFTIQNDSTFIVGTADPPALYFFDDKGTLQRKVDLQEEPRAVVCNDKEKIIVAHQQHIAVYTAEGECEASWTLPRKTSDVRSLAVTPDYLFAADTGSRNIYRFDTEGNLDLTFGKGFVVYAAPITMTFSPKNGLLYIVNPGRHRIEVFTQEGKSVPDMSWGRPSTVFDGFAGCCNPVAVAALDDGRILTAEKAISRVKIFDENRKLDCVVAGPRILDEQPPGAVGRLPLKPDRSFSTMPLSDGRIVVFDFEYATIRFFTPRQSVNNP